MAASIEQPNAYCTHCETVHKGRENQLCPSCRYEYLRIDFNKEHSVECPSCKGTGADSFGKCRTCKGAGWLYNNPLAPPPRAY